MGKSRRDIVKLDRRTGHVAVETETAESGSFSERAAGLAAAAHARLGDEPVIEQWAQLVCDGCGVTADVDLDAPSLPDGWRETDHGDLCAVCASTTR